MSAARDIFADLPADFLVDAAMEVVGSGVGRSGPWPQRLRYMLTTAAEALAWKRAKGGDKLDIEVLGKALRQPELERLREDEALSPGHRGAVTALAMSMPSMRAAWRADAAWTAEDRPAWLAFMEDDAPAA